MKSIVEDKLRCGEVGDPIIVSSVGEESEVLFDFLIGVLSLAVGLRMIHRCKGMGDSELLIKGLH